jgi:hypothetical protein
VHTCVIRSKNGHGVNTARLSTLGPSSSDFGDRVSDRSCSQLFSIEICYLTKATTSTTSMVVILSPSKKDQ